MNKLSLSILLVIGLTALTSYYLLDFFSGFEIGSGVNVNQTDAQKTSMLFQLIGSCFIYFFLLLTLPMLPELVIKWMKIKSGEIWKPILYLEFSLLLLAYLASPPDLMSTVYIFIACQPIVLVNTLSIRRYMTK